MYSAMHLLVIRAPDCCLWDTKTTAIGYMKGDGVCTFTVSFQNVHPFLLLAKCSL